MPIANYEEVRTVLKDFETRIHTVVTRAWAEWTETPNKGRFLFARTRSNIVFDAIARIAVTEFNGDENIHVIVSRQTIKFLFKDQVLVRFKKGNAKGIGSNIETQAVLDFIDPQLSMLDLPMVHRVEVCYQIDDLATSLKEIAVVARDRTKRVWHYALGSAMPSADVVSLAPRSAPDATPPLVTARKTAKKKDADTGKK